MASREADPQAHANDLLAILDRKQVDLDRAKRTRTLYLALAIPLLTLALTAFLTPQPLPSAFLLAVQALFALGMALVASVVVKWEPTIRALENEVIEVRKELRALKASAAQLPLDLGEDE